MRWVCSTHWSSTIADTSCKCVCQGPDRASCEGALMINKPMIGVAAAVVVVAAGSWYYLQSRRADLPPTAEQQPLPAEPPAEPAIEHPLPAGQGSAAKTPLPPLADR